MHTYTFTVRGAPLLSHTWRWLQAETASSVDVGSPITHISMWDTWVL